MTSLFSFVKNAILFHRLQSNACFQLIVAKYTQSVPQPADLIQTSNLKVKVAFAFLLMLSLFPWKYTHAASQAEIDALVSFYNSTNGDSWTSNANWNNGADPCDASLPWAGVTCNNGSVTELKRSNIGLSGTIPSAIGGLTNLTRLTLSGDGISGSLPAELGELTNLATLEIQNTSVGGEIPDLSGLTNLTSLLLNKNKLEGKLDGLVTSSSSFEMSSLKGIDLHGNKLHGEIPVAITQHAVDRLAAGQSMHFQMIYNALYSDHEEFHAIFPQNYGYGLYSFDQLSTVQPSDFKVVNQGSQTFTLTWKKAGLHEFDSVSGSSLIYYRNKGEQGQESQGLIDGVLSSLNVDKGTETLSFDVKEEYADKALEFYICAQTDPMGTQNVNTVTTPFPDQCSYAEYAPSRADISITTTVNPVFDPFNGTSNPKYIPGALAEYTIAISNSGSDIHDKDTISVMLSVPENTRLMVNDQFGEGTGPVKFTEGNIDSTLTFVFTALDSASDSLAFSNDEGETFTYSPVASSDGSDAAVTHVRANLSGVFADGQASPTGFTLDYRVLVE